MDELVRRMEMADLPDVLALQSRDGFLEWTERHFASEIHNAQSYPCVARNDTMLFGYAVLRLLGDEAELFAIVVKPETRRHGLGGRILDACLAWTKNNGANAVFLEVRDDNAPARKLYGSRKAEMVGCRKHYYRDGGDALLLRIPV